MAFLNFDATTISPETEFAPLPAGDYLVIITDSDVRTTKAGTGNYLHLKLQVIDGQHSSRVLFGNITMSNPNQTAADIGQRQLSALCHAVGVLRPEDSAQLHNIPLRVAVTIKRSDQYGESNEIKAYKPAGSSTFSAPKPASAPRPAQSAPAPAAQAPANAPWMQKAVG